jgi:hypothetical protein
MVIQPIQQVAKPAANDSSVKSLKPFWLEKNNIE